MRPAHDFASVVDGGAVLASVLRAEDLSGFHPTGAPLEPGPSRWDHTQQGAELEANQTDCTWFAFEASDVVDGRRFAGIVALHRTGARLASMGVGRGPDESETAPPAMRSVVRALSHWLPIRARFDPRPLFISVLYDLDGTDRPATCDEIPVDGAIDPTSFSFASRDGRQQLLVGAARSLREGLPPVLAAFFDYEGVAFAARTVTERFELELYLRPHKNPVAYGADGSPELRNGRTVIHYVQRPRLELVGVLRQRDARGALGAPRVLRGDATQDRHWMTLTDARLRWLWFMGRFDDGRECMVYQMRTADGGRDAPADTGELVGGGAWIVERSGAVRRVTRWTLVPTAHVQRPRGLVPTRFRLTMPDEGIRLVVEHARGTFVPTRALGEFVEAGIWESPARLVESEGVTGGRFWVDVMPPYGGV